MPRYIHARRRDGTMRYRLWSTIVDAYVSDELNEAELRERLLDDYSPRDVRSGWAEEEITERLARAHATGTSERSVTTGDVDGPWKVWPPDDEDDEEECE